MKENFLIMAAPAQNLDDGGRRVVQRFIPTLVAEALIRTREYKTGLPATRVYAWNCVGAKMDRQYEEYKKNHPDEGSITREEYSSRLLQNKYGVLTDLGINPNDGQTVTDDQPEVLGWLTNEVCRLVKEGVFFRQQVDIQVCQNCGYEKTVSQKVVGQCGRCDESHFHMERREELVFNLPTNKQGLYKDRVYLPKNQGLFKGMFLSLPDQVIVSKMRRYGLDLGFVGFEGYVLDPKIGIALLPEWLSEQFGFDQITQIQGLKTVTNTLPYTAVLSEGFESRYVLTPMIPRMNLGEASEMGLGFVVNYLPYVLMKRSTNMSESDMENARIEYRRIVNKFKNCLQIINEEGSLTMPDNDRNCLNRIIGNLMKYNIRAGLEGLRCFVFDVLSRDYVGQAKKTDNCLRKEDLSQIKNVVELLLGEI